MYLTLYCCVYDSVVRATYKKTKREDNDGETKALVRVVIRQVLAHPLTNVSNSTTAVNQRVSLWTSDCSAPFCSRRRPRFHRGNDYLIMGHVDRRTGHLLLDERSVVRKWKTNWPSHVQVDLVIIVCDPGILPFIFSRKERV